MSTTTTTKPQLATPSLCIECDAEPEACNHTGPRYLEPIAYIKAQLENGRAGYIVPAHERERWDHPIRAITQPKNITPDTRPLQELVSNLEDWIDVSGTLELLLREQYERDPSKTTRLVHYVLEQTKTGALRSPGGLLVVRLKAMETATT